MAAAQTLLMPQTATWRRSSWATGARKNPAWELVGGNQTKHVNSSKLLLCVLRHCLKGLGTAKTDRWWHRQSSLNLPEQMNTLMSIVSAFPFPFLRAWPPSLECCPWLWCTCFPSRFDARSTPICHLDRFVRFGETGKHEQRELGKSNIWEPRHGGKWQSRMRNPMLDKRHHEMR